MANSFSPTVSLNLQQFDSSYIAHSISPIITSQVVVPDGFCCLSPVYVDTPRNAELSLSMQVQPTGAGGLPINDGAVLTVIAASGNIISKSTEAEINCDSIEFSDSSTSGSMTIFPKSTSTSYQFTGVRCGIENNVNSFSVTQEKSGYIWTNYGAPSTITCSLPSGALEGTSVFVVRTGPDIFITPVGATMFVPESGLFRETGASVRLASSGSSYGLISNGNNQWYPIFEYGSIV